LKRFFLSAIAIIALAGCGQSAQPAASSKTTAPPSTAAAQGAPGFTLVASHDEIVAKAKAEGSLKVLSSADPKTFKAWQAAFTKKYPFIKTDIEEITGTDSAQRFLLEFKSGQAKDWDVVHISDENHAEMEPYIDKIDLVGMAEKGVLSINPKMINPATRNIMSPASQIGVIAYNNKLVSADQAPKTWDDVLDPKWKGRKVVTDIRPNVIAGVIPVKGEEWAKDWAAKMKDLQPVWARGNTGAFTSIAAGEYLLHSASYLNTVERLIQSGTATLSYVVPEPVPVRYTLSTGIQQGVKHPMAGLLYLEFIASAEGQKILDEVEPMRASIYGDKSTKTYKAVEGKQLSEVTWDLIPKMANWEKMVLNGFGLPSAEIKN